MEVDERVATVDDRDDEVRYFLLVARDPLDVDEFVTANPTIRAMEHLRLAGKDPAPAWIHEEDEAAEARGRFWGKVVAVALTLLGLAVVGLLWKLTPWFPG